MSYFTKLRRWARQPPQRRLLLAEAAVWLALARVVLILFPFRTIAARLGTVSVPNDASRREPANNPSPETVRVAQAVGWAVGRAARHLPFEAVCLPQALAAKMMLRRRGIESSLHFGVRRSGGAAAALEAHAWLDAAAVKVTGYPVATEFVEIVCFL